MKDMKDKDSKQAGQVLRQPRQWSRMRRSLIIGLAMALTALGVVGALVVIGSDRFGASPSAVQAARAPDFSVQTVGGGTFSLSEHGGQPVVLFFMTPNCPSCVRALPSLARAREEFSPQGLQVVGLNLFPETYSLDEVVEYAESLGAGTLTWAQDTEADIARSYEVTGLGEIVVIDRKTYIAERFKGPVTYPALKDMARRADAR